MRVHGLDALRGLCAIGVVVYHLMAWSDAQPPFGLGLYGVYIFFVISGASLYIAYRDTLNTQADLVRFVTNRAWRIIPLFAVVVICSAFLSPATATFGRLWMNLTMTFGLGNPGAMSNVGGGWSLGIEDVFYLCFPIFCALSRTRGWWAIALILLISQRSFVEMSLAPTLAITWNRYTQPLAFVSYFFVGCCIGRAHCDGHLMLPRWSVIPAFLCLFGVLALNPSETGEAILKGPPGVTMTLLSFAIVLTAAQLRGGGVFRRGSDFLGSISYGTYLIHPLLWTAFYWKRPELPLPLLVAVFVPVAVALGWFSNRYFEMPLRRYGRRRFGGTAALPQATNVDKAAISASDVAVS